MEAFQPQFDEQPEKIKDTWHQLKPKSHTELLTENGELKS